MTPPRSRPRHPFRRPQPRRVPRSLAVLATLNVFYGCVAGAIALLVLAAFALWGRSIVGSLVRSNLLGPAAQFAAVVLFITALYVALAVGHIYAGLRLRNFVRRARIVAMILAVAHILFFFDRVAGLVRDHDGSDVFWALVQLLYIVMTFAILMRADIAARFDGLNRATAAAAGASRWPPTRPAPPAS